MNVRVRSLHILFARARVSWQSVPFGHVGELGAWALFALFLFEVNVDEINLFPLLVLVPRRNGCAMPRSIRFLSWLFRCLRSQRVVFVRSMWPSHLSQGMGDSINTHILDARSSHHRRRRCRRPPVRSSSSFCWSTSWVASSFWFCFVLAWCKIISVAVILQEGKRQSWSERTPSWPFTQPTHCLD